MKRSLEILVSTMITAMLILPALALADTNPRDTFPLPAGTDVALFYYRAVNGSDLYRNGKKVSNNADLDGNIMVARYIHYSKVGDFPILFDIYQPFGSLNFEYGPINDRATGLGDTTIHGVIWTPDLIGKADSNFWFGLMSLYISAPTGEYQTEKFVNLGSNRWTITPEIGLWHYRYKRFWTEGLVDLTFYTDNDDYSSVLKGYSHLNQKKDPLLTLFVHASYDITRSFWLGFTYMYQEGGETEVKGLNQNDKTRTTTLKFTGAVKVAPNISLMAQYVTDVDVENGVAQNYFQTRLGYAW